MPLIVIVDIFFAMAAALLLAAATVDNTSVVNNNFAGLDKTASKPLPPSKSSGADGTSYMLRAATYDWATISRKKIQKIVDGVQECSGIALKISENSDYKFISPQKKWLITAGPFSEQEAGIATKKLTSCGMLDSKVKEAEVDE